MTNSSHGRMVSGGLISHRWFIGIWIAAICTTVLL